MEFVLTTTTIPIVNTISITISNTKCGSPVYTIINELRWFDHLLLYSALRKLSSIWNSYESNKSNSPESSVSSSSPIAHERQLKVLGVEEKVESVEEHISGSSSSSSSIRQPSTWQGFSHFQSIQVPLSMEKVRHRHTYYESTYPHDNQLNPTYEPNLGRQTQLRSNLGRSPTTTRTASKRLLIKIHIMNLASTVHTYTVHTYR